MDLKDFLKLAGQQGKVVVMGEDGNVKGVFLSFDEFEKLSGNANTQKAQPTVPQENLVEKANREIMKAQLEEVISTLDGGMGAPMLQNEIESDIEPLERLDSLLSKRAQALFKSMPANTPLDFPYKDYTTPQVTNNSDEEIKPNFDDI